MYISSGFALVLMFAIGLLGVIVQARMNSVFNKYSRKRFSSNLTGKEVAEKMLRDNGIYDVKVMPVRGNLTDNYNPVNKTLNLSESVYNNNSISATAVAAHECGHAIQHAYGYGPLKLRTALVPVISVTSKWSTWVIIIGLIFISVFPEIFWAGIIMIALSALFSIITLPVEYNASSRAIAWLERSGTINPLEVSPAKETLRWAARTYLVAALSAIVVLIYYLGIARRNQ